MDYSKKVTTEDLTFEGLLKKTNEEYMYSLYLGYSPETKKMYKSPFNDERTPSFNFYYKNNRLRFKDYSSNNTGTVIDLIMKLYNLDYLQALIKLDNDLNGRLVLVGTNNHNSTFSSKLENKIEIVPKLYTQEDIDYWKQYYLDIQDLEYFNIKPCKEVWLNDKLWYTYNSKNPCYRYVFNGKYKVYKPLDKTGYKWLNNCNNIENIQGFVYLDDTSDTLIITKSFKDVACIKKHLEYNAISFHGESHYIKEDIINYFKKRYKNIYFFYDNDKSGIRDVRKLSELYNIPHIILPDKGAKDISDYIKLYGITNAKQIVKLLIDQENGSRIKEVHSSGRD
jgi:hypothetical protein